MRNWSLIITLTWCVVIPAFMDVIGVCNFEYKHVLGMFLLWIGGHLHAIERNTRSEKQ